MSETPQKRWPRWLGQFVALSLALSAGCSTASFDRLRWWRIDDWAADYETAEHRADTLDAPRVLYFKNQNLAHTDPVFEALTAPEIKSRLSNYVHGTLVQTHEPDRRYAAQFGIDRAPAVIVIHRDGTFHALTGLIDTESLARFLDQATPPGSTPTRNLLVPRTYRYTWMGDLEAAEARAKQQGKPLVVVYERRLMGDTRHLEQMLETREVGLRLADDVHCRISLLPTVGDAFISPFGSIRLPAMVMVYPDGRHDVLEMPTSSEAVARFVDASRRGDVAPAKPSSSATPVNAAP